MKKIFFYTVLIIVLISCKPSTSDQVIEQWKQEIRETEEQFAKMVKEEGIHNAFVYFAAEDAVVMRNDIIYKGQNAIDTLYKNSHSKSLTWSPDFIDVSSSGDLAYTYGTYKYTYKDSTETENVNTGIFHTVWKRQADGNWKFVWD